MTIQILWKKIRESEEYITYKSERKEKSQNSGLACDQGMSNYSKFLEYLAAKEETVPRIKGAENVLLYGVPGVGKVMKYKQSIVMIQKEWRGWYFIPIIHTQILLDRFLPKGRE